MKIRTMLLAVMCLTLFASVLEAKPQKSEPKREGEIEQAETKTIKIKKRKEKKCYTHTRKWHECPSFEPKSNSGE